MVERRHGPVGGVRRDTGAVEALEGPFRIYFAGSIFTYRRINIDVSVERERFPVRTLPPAESASVRASFHAAMNRPMEARAAIAEARKADPNAAGQLCGRGRAVRSGGEADEAKAAYAKAAALGSTSAYAHYRLASLTWQPNPSRETLAEIEKHLAKSHQLEQPVRCRVRLARRDESRSRDRRSNGADPASHLHRAEGGAPSPPRRPCAVASGQARRGAPDAEAALALAETDADRREAQELLDTIARAKPGGDARAPAARRAPIPALLLHAEKMSDLELEANVTLCPDQNSTFCRELVPILDALCVKRHAVGCRLAGTLFERGIEVRADSVRAAAYYRRACDAGDRLGCEGLARVMPKGRAAPRPSTPDRDTDVPRR